MKTFDSSAIELKERLKRTKHILIFATFFLIVGFVLLFSVSVRWVSSIPVFISIVLCLYDSPNHCRTNEILNSFD